MDAWINNMPKITYKEITEKIIGASFEGHCPGYSIKNSLSQLGQERQTSFEAKVLVELKAVIELVLYKSASVKSTNP